MEKYQRRTNKSKKSKRMMMTRRSKKSRSYKRSYKSKNKKGGAPQPPSYVGSIQGEFINNKGQQLFRNPVGGIA
jgi:hypothetical protein